MLAARCVALLLPFCLFGCVAFQDCEYRAAQSCRAHCAWWVGCVPPNSCNPWSHYSYGWRQGYQDVLLGGDGTCPPVPPHCYWSPKFQCELGEQAIERWFEGYHDGSEAALASCRGQYHPVPLSNEFRQSGHVSLSSDLAPYDFGRTILGVRLFPLPSQSTRNSSDESAPLETVPSPAREDTSDARDQADPIDDVISESPSETDESIPPSATTSHRTATTKASDHVAQRSRSDSR
jgi:hypothetical protein